MSKINHISDDKKQGLFKDLGVTYSKSKEAIWEEMSHAIEKNTVFNQPKIIKMQWLKYVAAVFILLVGSLSFMRFYSVEFYTANGEFATHILPDGSEIEMNAGSTISYLPYWWDFNREVTLEGEAFFKVEKGSQFSVHSDNGTTQVLGTSFNIFARTNEYNVYCKSGKVKVTDPNSIHVYLEPGDYAQISNDVVITSEISEIEALSWKHGEFVYNTTPLTKVLEDFEREYDVKINTDSEIINKLNYTGIFERSIIAEDAIKLVCLSFDLRFEKTDRFTFRIY
jgi:transmembrane sensor